MERLFFSHIPKNGGMAIRYFLRNQFATERVCQYEEWAPMVLAPEDELAGYSLFQGHFHFDLRRLLPPVQVISFFREPVARTLSLLLHLRRDPDFHAMHQRAKGKSISEMLADQVIVDHIANQQTAYLGGVIDFVRLRQQLQNAPAEFDIGQFMGEPSLTLALKRLDELAYVGLTDQLDRSLNQLSQQFGLHPCLEYAKRNQSGDAEKKLIADLSQADLDKLRGLNRLDFELYEAAQSRFSARAEAYSFAFLARRSLQLRGEPVLDAANQLDLAEPLTGTNWYEPERFEAGAAYRWSGPGQRSSLELPLALQEWEMLQIVVFPHAGDDLASSLKLTVDGEAAAPARLNQDQLYVFDLLLTDNPVSSQQGYHQILFWHDVSNPMDPASTDIRTLHFALVAVRLVGERRAASPGLQPRTAVMDGSMLAMQQSLADQSERLLHLQAEVVQLRQGQTEVLQTLQALNSRLDHMISAGSVARS